ncbi:MAG: hypothetical protein WCK73_12655 [Deltaproteobacteria bacterium]
MQQVIKTKNVSRAPREYGGKVVRRSIHGRPAAESEPSRPAQGPKTGARNGRSGKVPGPNLFQPNSMSVTLVGFTPEGLEPLSLEKPRKGQGVTVHIRPGSVHGMDCVHRAPERGVPSTVAEGKVLEVDRDSGLLLAEVKVVPGFLELYPYDETLYVTISTPSSSRFTSDMKLGLHCERPDLKVLGSRNSLEGRRFEAGFQRELEDSCCSGRPAGRNRKALAAG